MSFGEILGNVIHEEGSAPTPELSIERLSRFDIITGQVHSKGTFDLTRGEKNSAQ